jgi:two-component system, OmpR family, aerobic respiration control sensor histidine kinase ArcB
VAQSLLSNLGYQVEVAVSGEQVLEKFKPGKYDLIFMDIGLPDMEGTDVT